MPSRLPKGLRGEVPDFRLSTPRALAALFMAFMPGPVRKAALRWTRRPSPRQKTALELEARLALCRQPLVTWQPPLPGKVHWRMCFGTVCSPAEQNILIPLIPERAAALGIDGIRLVFPSNEDASAT